MKIFKKRKLDFDEPVHIYRNLNRKGRVFSIKQKGLVVAHTEYFVLKDCSFIIQKKAKEKAIKEQRRNVHAFIKGYLGTEEDILNSFSWILKYDPFYKKGFIVCNDHKEYDVKKAFTVYTQGNYLMTQI